MRPHLGALLLSAAVLAGAAPARTVRLCASQPARRSIDWHLPAAAALAEADKSLGALERLVDQAGAAGCDAFALPEDTLGLLNWEAAHEDSLNEVLPQAAARMLDRLGSAAARHRMYLVCSNDITEPGGGYYNTAFFLGRDGKQIGRYFKAHPTVGESSRRRGQAFPVFETPDLGGVGMLICYDMVFPEAPRALALAGAGIIFVPTLGGAVTTGDADLNRAAFRTRAADNYVYLVIAKRGGGAMIVSPQGKILAEGDKPDGMAIADIDPFGGREGGDAHNSQADMRARLFRERNPAAYALLTHPNPPILTKLPVTITVPEAVRIFAGTLTTGEERFHQAEALLRAGKTAEALRAFQALRAEFPATWIDRAAAARLAKLQ